MVSVIVRFISDEFYFERERKSPLNRKASAELTSKQLPVECDGTEANVA